MKTQKTYTKNTTKKTAEKGKPTRYGHTESRGKNNRTQYLSVHKVQRSDELLEFLLKKLNTSRNNVKALLSRRQVLVNGSVITQFNFALAKDDEVKIARESVREEEGGKRVAAQVKRTKTDKSTPAPKVKVLYEDDDLIAVEKPEGLLSVESDKEKECAFAQVLQYLQSKDKSSRPFILHRIDKETSGVLLFAKNIKLHSMLRMQWNELVQTREYVAVCEGIFEKKEDTVISYLRENANNLVYSTQDPTGQKAITHYKVEKEGGGYSFVRVQIDTGRKNQIRVHMQLVGHPIVGDDKYGHTKNPLGRLGLHASCLTILHPITKELLTFRSSVPANFHKCFAK
jgi:RluA family pseudouridine synthase